MENLKDTVLEIKSSVGEYESKHNESKEDDDTVEGYDKITENTCKDDREDNTPNETINAGIEEKDK